MVSAHVAVRERQVLTPGATPGAGSRLARDEYGNLAAASVDPGYWGQFLYGCSELVSWFDAVANPRRRPWCSDAWAMD